MLSIVIPVFNEEESLPHLYEELLPFVEKGEILFIDDGSTDSSLKKLREFEKKSKNISVYSFRKNMGKSEALFFGFQKARGDFVATIDADLQDKPEEIEKLLEKGKEGWDLVCGWRKNRKDPYKKVLSSKFFNFLARKFWGLKLHDYNCGLKLYSHEAAKNLSLYGGLHRFIPLLVYLEGFSVCEVPVNHEVRKFGKSKYGFSKLWKDMPDLFTMFFLTRFGSRPLHFFGWFGGLLFSFGTIVLLYLTFLKILGQSIGNRPLLFLGILLVLTGLQVLFTGFLADLITSQKEKTRQFLLRYSSER